MAKCGFQLDQVRKTNSENKKRMLKRLGELLHTFAKDNVSTIEPAGGDRGDEELGAVCVWTCVRHAQLSWNSVLKFEVLVRKFLTVDRLAAHPVAHSEISSLNHKVRNDPVELAALIVEGLTTLTLKRSEEKRRVKKGQTKRLSKKKKEKRKR